MKYKRIIGLLVAMLALTASATTPAKSKEKPTAPIQSLTYANVVSHFKAAGLRTTEVQKRCSTWTNGNVYNYGLIIVENSDENLQVTFYLTDAHEMNWVTEFLDAPFLAQSETEKLFNLINDKQETRDQKIGRFRVDFHRWKPRHAEIIVFSFTPALNAVGHQR